MNKHYAVLLTLIIGVSLGLGLAFIVAKPNKMNVAEVQPIEWLENPRSLRKFKLESESGSFDNRSLKGHWTIVLFGFLSCPDICPTSLSQLAALTNSLRKMSIDSEVNYVFVSVDPARDSISAINSYLQHFDTALRGVTGTRTELDSFSHDLGIQFEISADSDNYNVAHSVTFSIIDTKGIFQGRFRPGFNTLELSKNLASRINDRRLLSENSL